MWLYQATACFPKPEKRLGLSYTEPPLEEQFTRELARRRLEHTA